MILLALIYNLTNKLKIKNSLNKICYFKFYLMLQIILSLIKNA